MKQDKNTAIWAILTIASIVIGIVSILFLVFSKWIPFPYNYINDSNQILSLAIAVCSFMLFKNISVPQSKLINSVASTTFGILLIHANSDIMRQWLWKDVVDCVGNFASPLWYAPLSVFIIFAICSLIDIVRQKTLEIPMVDNVEKLMRCVQQKLKFF